MKKQLEFSIDDSNLKKNSNKLDKSFAMSLFDMLTTSFRGIWHLLEAGRLTKSSNANREIKLITNDELKPHVSKRKDFFQ